MSESRERSAAVLLRGSVPLPGFSNPPEIRWHLTLTTREGTSQFFIDSFRFKLLEANSNAVPRVGVDELKYLFNAVSAQVRPELTKHLDRVERAAKRASRRGLDYAPYRSLIQGLPPIHQRLTILRDEHERRVKSGELANNNASLSIGEASKQSGVATTKILELEADGLLNPARSEGGQRRFSQADVARIKELAQRKTAKTRSVTQLQDSHDSSFGDPVAAMSAPHSENRQTRAMASEFGPSQIKDMTVATVAELYLEACDRFPNRDQSVIEYIRKHMNWLSEDYIVTIIRMARRRGIALPVYRRGRLPKKVIS